MYSQHKTCGEQGTGQGLEGLKKVKDLVQIGSHKIVTGMLNTA